MHAPTDNHWVAVKHILHYLKGIVEHGRVFYCDSSHEIHAYSHVDWAGCLLNRQSTNGYVIFFGRNLISWSAKKQLAIARLSVDVEHKAMANATMEVLWIMSLLKEIGVSTTFAPQLRCDNIGATYLVANLVFHAHTKHVEIDYHFV